MKPESRTSGTNRDKFVDILAGSKTVAWLDKHILSLNLAMAIVSGDAMMIIYKLYFEAYL